MTSPERSGGETVTEAAWIAAIVPEWFRVEGQYAWDKFRDYGNPQAAALYGGLDPELGKAHLDFANYFGRFSVLYEQADGEPMALLQASRALGKFMNAGRVLNVTLIQDQKGFDVSKADELVMQQIVRICRLVDEVVMPEDLETYWRDFNGLLRLVNDSINNLSAPEFRMAAASRLMEDQIKLFIAFTKTSGVIAQPGTSSSDSAQPWTID